MVHFIINWRKHCALKPVRSLATSTDTTYQLRVIILANATGVLSAEGTSSNSLVQVTIKRIIQGQINYCLWTLYVCVSREGSESEWPSAEIFPWVNDQQKMCRFSYVLSGCDFLPAITGIYWGRKSCFPTLIFVQREGKLRVDINAGLGSSVLNISLSTRRLSP